MSGRFFDQDEDDRAAPVCVLGAAAKWSLFGSSNPLGQYVKGNEQWLRLMSGRFFDQDEDDRAAPVCVLGAAAKWSLFGSSNPLGQYVKVNEQWFRVIGVVSPQLSSQGDSSSTPNVDVNNNI